MLIPPALALNCIYLSGFEKDTCTQINGLPLSETEKEMTLTASLKNDKSIPNHKFVSTWNTQIQMDTPPEGVPTQSSGVIKDGWVKLASIMPSVIENDIIYADKEGTIQSFYNYKLELPTGTASGDCKTTYSLTNQYVQLNVFLNNVLTGTSKISTFQVSEQGNITVVASLLITVQTKKDHYRDYTYCSRYYKGSKKCRAYSTECRYTQTDYTNDALFITDTRNAHVSPYTPSYTFQTLNEYDSSTKGKVNADNYTSFQLSFADSSYKKNNYLYEYVYSLQPYNVLTIKALPFKQETSQNINTHAIDTSSFEFIVKNKQNCSLTLFTHFSHIRYACFPEIILKNVSITTDKLHYFQNETITVDIEPKATSVTIKYGNEKYFVQDSLTLRADQKYSRVSASYQDEQDIQVISVTEKDHLRLASQISLFLLINYVTFALLTRETWILQWLNVAS
ncbi:MAG: hypothetical protein Q7R87_04340 [Nanoarchaeota archaeon]|nr:hypothetical protein [Nanoarchaeota archaeon]